MIIKDIGFTLKDGRNALIRSPRDEDIPGMLEYLRISAGVGYRHSGHPQVAA